MQRKLTNVLRRVVGRAGSAVSGLKLLVLGIALLALVPGRAVSSPRPTPVRDRLRVHREILDLKIRAAREPRSADSVRERLVRIYLETGEPEKAVALYRQAIIFDRPRASVYHRRIARIYRDLGRNREAEEEFQKAEAAAPETEAARLRRQLAAWEEEGRDDLLLQQYRFLYWTRNRTGDQYLGRIARMLSGRGEEEESSRYYRRQIADYRRRIEERPTLAVNYHLRIAGIYEEMGEEEAAGEEYRRAVEIEGEAGGRALVSQGDNYRSRGDYGRALALYREAASRPGIDPVSIRFRIASLLERKGEVEEALAELRLAEELDDDEAGSARFRIARFLERRGELEAAREEYRSLLPGLDPGRRAGVWERIASLSARLEQEDLAAQAYREALRCREEELGEDIPTAAFLERAVGLAERGGREEEAEEYSRMLMETYRVLLDRDPGRAGYYHRRLGDALRRRGEFQQAAAHYRTWSGLAPEDPAPHYRLYRLYRDHLDNPRGSERHRERYRELRGRRTAASADRNPTVD